jgi:hypothetical protein
MADIDNIVLEDEELVDSSELYKGLYSELKSHLESLYMMLRDIENDVKAASSIQIQSPIIRWKDSKGDVQETKIPLAMNYGVGLLYPRKDMDEELKDIMRSIIQRDQTFEVSEKDLNNVSYDTVSDILYTIGYGLGLGITTIPGEDDYLLLYNIKLSNAAPFVIKTAEEESRQLTKFDIVVRDKVVATILSMLHILQELTNTSPYAALLVDFNSVDTIFNVMADELKRILKQVANAESSPVLHITAQDVIETLQDEHSVYLEEIPSLNVYALF